LAVLDAQRSKLAVSDERAKAETAVSVAMVSLYRAFGGGWTSASSDRVVSIKPRYGNQRLTRSHGKHLEKR